MSKQKTPRRLASDILIKLLMAKTADIFWACVLMRLKVFMTDTIVPALGTDGKFLIINNDWIARQPIETGMAGFVHEACHIALKHNIRRGNRNFELWNDACDYVINLLIAKRPLSDGSWTGYDIPPTWLYDLRFAGMSAEQVYDILLSERKAVGGAGGGQGNGQPTMFDPNMSGHHRSGELDILFDFPAMTPDEKKIAEEQIDAALAGIMSSLGAGKVPGFMQMELEARHKHVVDYRDLLRDWLTKNVFHQDYSWLHADRRFVGTGFHIPMLIESSDGAPSILIVVDSSGSVWNKRDLPAVAAEIQGVLEEFPGKYFVLYGDTDFRNAQEITDEKPLKLDIKGGGGTDFRRLMRHIKNSDYEYDAMLFFTDMDTMSFGEDPGKPVLWMNISHQYYKKPPFGKVIQVPRR